MTHATCLKSAVLLLAACGGLTAGDLPREGIEWCRVWIPGADKPDVTRVLLVGDSITVGYYNGVSQELTTDGIAAAHLATSRSVCDPMFVDELRPTVEGYRWAVIHFNNGIHGQDYGDEQYRDGMRKALKYLKEKCPSSRIVVVLSTPPRPGAEKKAEQMIVRRNKIARRLAEEMKLPVDDLFTPMSGHKDYYRDLYHFRGPAIKQQVQQVVQVVRKVLAEKAK